MKESLNQTTYEKLRAFLLEKSNNVVPYIIAIDGRCAAGKSTLAKTLAQDLNASILKMDDFFLRNEQRTPERYKEPGGNVDRERVEEVLKSYLHDKKIEYAPFDCHAGHLANLKEIPYTNILIVEGSYSFHPLLEPYYHFKIFMHVNAEIQLERIEKRNGKKMLEMFVDKWIPYEENYFKTLHIEEKADIVLDTSLGETYEKNVY